jgi:hypothetical protein
MTPRVLMALSSGWAWTLPGPRVSSGLSWPQAMELRGKGREDQRGEGVGWPDGEWPHPDDSEQEDPKP